MPRQLRLECRGAKYHVMCRGDRREKILVDEPRQAEEDRANLRVDPYPEPGVGRLTG
jgi:REP element-mobilizing transposase RayT